MKLIRKKIDSEPEKDIVTGLIVSDRFIKEIFPILDLSYLQIDYAKMISKWCIDYYQKYSKPPGKDIEKIFKVHKKSKKIDEEILELIEDFLIALNKRYKEFENFNEKYLIDNAEKYLKKRNMEILIDDTSAYLLDGDIEKAESTIATHSRIERLSDNFVDLMKDDKKIISNLLEEENEVFRYPGALGEMVGPICRGDFLSYIGPMKRGKTWHLIHFAIRALLQQKKVLFVSMEMPMKQLIERFYQNILGQSRKERKDIVIPYFSDDNELSFKNVDRKGLKVSQIIKKNKKLQMLVKGGGLNIVCYPSHGANIEKIKNEINNLAHYKKFYPDAVIIDYLDLMSPEPGSPRDVRHRIDHTWSVARGLAQEIDGVVVTVSQGNRGTFQKNVDEEGVAEDIRKLAHVTHMIALNQSKDDKKNSIMRMGMIVNRNEEFFIDDEVIVAYQYAIGKAYLDSRWKKDVSM